MGRAKAMTSTAHGRRGTNAHMSHMISHFVRAVADSRYILYSHATEPRAGRGIRTIVPNCRETRGRSHGVDARPLGPSDDPLDFPLLYDCLQHIVGFMAISTARYTSDVLRD